MKATLGGYRHLIRNTSSTRADQTAQLKEILTRQLPQAISSHPVQSASTGEDHIADTLASALYTLTSVADRRYGKDAHETLWTIRLDTPMAEKPGDTAETWKNLQEKVEAETLDNPLSLVRIVNAITHLGASRGLTLAGIATLSLQQVNN